MRLKRQLKILFGKILGPPIELLIRNFPGLIGYGLRYYYYKLRLAHIGKRVAIDTNVYFINPEYISIGDKTWIDKNTIIIAGPPKKQKVRKIYKKGYEKSRIRMGEIYIGKENHIGPNVILQGHGGLWIGDSCGIIGGSKIYTLSHHYKNLLDPGDNTIYKFISRAPLEEQALISAPVEIGNNAGIGLNSIILPGARIGENSWIGALSLVKGDIPDNVIAWGIPARVIKKRFEE